ncbi:MAG: tetratricopeptide repeat protein [Chthoniobacteraceae bacterium]
MFRRCLSALIFFVCALVQAQQAPSARVIERYKQMLSANPVEGTALDRLWDDYAQQGTSADLLREYENATTFEGVMLYGHLLRKAGKSDAARIEFQKAASLNAQSHLPMLSLGRLEKAASHHAEAAAALDQAVKLWPKSDRGFVDILMELGGEWMAAGDAERAAAAWEKIIAIDPKNVALHRQLAEAYVRKHLADRALPHLHFVEEHGSPQERAESLREISELEQARGNQDAAIAALEKAIAGTAPGNWFRAELQSQLIRLHQRYHRTAELEEKWKRYAAGNARDLGAYLQLIDLYARLGDLDQELTWLEKLCTLAPKNLDYRMQLARLLAQMDRLDPAASVYDELLAVQPRNADLFFERARLQMRRGQSQVAGEEVARFVAAAGAEESVRGKALDFFESNRLFTLEERQLAEDAGRLGEDGMVAYARFLFARGREAAARRALSGLIRAEESPGQRAAAHFKVAQILKGQSDVAGAIASVRAAIDLNAEVRDYHFLLGELESSRAAFPAAQSAFDRAFQLSATETDRIEADQRLYESLQRQQKPAETNKSPRAPGLLSGDPAAATSAAAQGYLLNLRRQAVEHPSEAAWLRVARWQMWSRNIHQATDAANRALDMNPASLDAHKFLADLRTGETTSPLANQHLRELIRLDPANEISYQRRIAHGELQAGRIEEALRIFRQIAESNPGDLEALGDLGLAQQRADQWMEALETMKRAHALSPPSQRRESAAALLRIYDRLAMRQPAADLLLEQVDAADEIQARFSVFQELLAHCSRHGLLDWLHDEFVRRRQMVAGDYFTEMALGRVLKEQGHKAAAFEVLADAALSAPDQGESLPELVREAEELRKLETAIELQERLVRVVPPTTPREFERLAQLQEKNLDPESAAKTWERTVGKFPRDVAVLDGGANFQRRWGHPQKALAWIERRRALEPGNLRAALDFAGVAIECEEPVQAAEALEFVLSKTPAPGSDDPIRFPSVQDGSGSTAALRIGSGPPMEPARRSSVPVSGSSATAEMRETAIRELGKLIAERRDSADLKAWIKRWQAPEQNVSERLLALFAVEAGTELLNEIEKLIPGQSSDSEATTAFTSLAFELREFERLGAWLRAHDRNRNDRTIFITALDHYLDAHDRGVDPRLMTALFPPAFRYRRWEAAESFRRHGLIHEAAELGRPIFAQGGLQRAAMGLEVASWYILEGRLDQARAVLRDAMDETADNYGASAFEAMHMLDGLLPPSEREGVFGQFDASLEDQKHPLHAALSRALLAGLCGDQAAAEEQLQILLDSRSLTSRADADSGERIRSGAQFWDFILQTGRQLQSWDLDSLAEFLWGKALEDPAWLRLQIETQGNQVRERIESVEGQWAAVRLLHADPDEFNEVFTQYADSVRATRPEAVLALAETLEAMGGSPRAIEIYRRLWESDPGNPNALRNLGNACRNAGDTETLEFVLRKTIADGYFQADESTRKDLAFQLVDVLEERGDLEEALRILNDLQDRPPRDARVALRIAVLQERAGQTSLAEAAYRRVLSAEPTRTAARVALASLLDARQDVAGAIEILERGAGADIDARVAPLYLKIGRVDEAVAALERIPAPGHVPATLTVVDELMKGNHRRDARLVLRAALARGFDAQTNFPLQSRMVELLEPDDDPVLINHEWRQLRQMAAGEDALPGAYFDVLAREAPRLRAEDRFLSELRAAWNEGTGSLVAGVVLLDWQLAHGAESDATATWARLGDRADLDDRSAERAAASFQRYEMPARRIEALEKLARIDAPTTERFIEWARALEDAGRHEEALRVAELVAARAVLPAESLPPAAELLVALGATDRALDLYAEAVADDPAAREYDVHLAYAHLLVETGEMAAARPVLKNAFRNPANARVGALTEWLRATGKLAEADTELTGFALKPSLLTAMRRAVWNELYRTGAYPAGLKLLGEHLELLDPSILPEVRDAAKKGRAFPDTARLLERALAQRATPTVVRESALFYVDWSRDERAAGDANQAAAHLARAHELDPALWTAAEAWSALLIEKGEIKNARRVLEKFLGASSTGEEKEKARALLARLPNSGPP